MVSRTRASFRWWAVAVLLFLVVDPCFSVTTRKIDWNNDSPKNTNWPENARDMERYTHPVFVREAATGLIGFFIPISLMLVTSNAAALFQTASCSVENVPEGFHVQTVTWSSGDEHFPTLDNSFFEAVVLSQVTFDQNGEAVDVEPEFAEEKKATGFEEEEDEDDDSDDEEANDGAGEDSAAVEGVQEGEDVEVGSKSGSVREVGADGSQSSQDDSSRSWKVSSFNDATMDMNGELSFMAFKNPSITDVYEAKPGSLLIAINCKEFDEHTEHGNLALRNLQGFFDETASVDRGISRSHPVTFTFIVPNENMEWKYHDQKRVSDEQMFLLPSNESRTGFAVLPRGIGDFLTRSRYHHEDPTPLDDVEGAKRKLFNVTNDADMKSDIANKILSVIVILTVLVVPLAPIIMLMNDEEGPIQWLAGVLGVQHVPNKPFLAFLDAFRTLFIVVAFLVVLSFVLPRLKKLKIFPNRVVDVIYKAIVLAVAAFMPIRLFLLGGNYKKYNNFVVRAQMQFITTWVNHVLAIMFFGHSVVAFMRDMYNVELPNLFHESTAELILGLMGAIEAVCSMIELGGEVFDIPGTCDLNHLNTIVEETAKAQNLKDYSFAISCSEAPACSTALSDNTFYQPGQAATLAWERMNANFSCTADYDSDRKDVSDATACKLTCSMNGVDHETLVTCAPCFIFGGCWGFEQKSKIAGHVCGGSNTAADGLAEGKESLADATTSRLTMDTLQDAFDGEQKGGIDQLSRRLSHSLMQSNAIAKTNAKTVMGAVGDGSVDMGGSIGASASDLLLVKAKYESLLAKYESLEKRLDDMGNRQQQQQKK